MNNSTPDSANGGSAAVVANASDHYQQFRREVSAKAKGATDLDEHNAAMLFAAAWGHEARHCQSENCWYLASRTKRPGLWSVENRHGAQLRMQALIDETQSSTRGAFINSALKAARPLLSVKPEDFNKDPHLFAATNGVVDLRDGSFSEIRSEMMLTCSAAAAYHPEAKCPQWEDHIRVLLRAGEDVNSPAPDGDVAFVQELFGMGLIGTQPEHVVVSLYGPGGNGKDTADDTFKKILGGYGGTLDSGVLYARPDAHTTGLADLQGKRHVSISELPDGKKINTQILKRITGGGTLKARKMRQDNVEFEPTHSLWMISNDPPNFGLDESEGLWRRVIMVHTGPTIPDVQRKSDTEHKAELLAEGPGILRWAVEGAVRFLERGKLPAKPASVQLATDTLKSESRLLRRFLHEECTAAPDEQVLLADFTRSYLRWMQDEGELNPNDKMPTRQVAGKLRGMNYKVDKGSKNKTFVFGVQLSPTSMLDRHWPA